jgi:hypothetical protein
MAFSVAQRLAFIVIDLRRVSRARALSAEMT